MGKLPVASIAPRATHAQASKNFARKFWRRKLGAEIWEFGTENKILSIENLERSGQCCDRTLALGL